MWSDELGPDANSLDSNRCCDNTLNVFNGIHKNYLFMLISLVMMTAHTLIICYGGDAFGVIDLTSREWAVSVGLGVLPLPLGMLIRLISDEWIVSLIPAKLKTRGEWGVKTVQNIDEEQQMAKRKVRSWLSMRGSHLRRLCACLDGIQVTTLEAEITGCSTGLGKV